MKRLIYGTEDENEDIPGNLLEDNEPITAVLIPSKELSDKEKPGEIEIEEGMEDDLLEKAEKIDPSEYLVRRWDNGKAKRIYSEMIGTLQDDWKDVDSIEEALPDDWVVDPDGTDRNNYIDKRDDGSVVIKGVCPECSESERTEDENSSSE